MKKKWYFLWYYKPTKCMCMVLIRGRFSVMEGTRLKLS
jgi:hypothetical protein